MNFTFKEENKGTYQETSHEQIALNINNQIQDLLTNAGVSNYQPQSFTSLPQFLNLYDHLRTQLTADALSKIEGLVALYGALSSVNNYTGFVSVLTLYAKTHNKQSLIASLKDIAVDLFSNITPQSSDRPKWLDDMTTALTNWKLLINSPSFAKISRVLSLLVTLGVTDRISITFGNFELFAVEAMHKQANAIDLIDACIETIVFFAEGAYTCFTQGSLRPLLFSSSEIVQLEEKYIQLQTEWEFVRNGNLQKYVGKDESEFDKDLNDTIDTLATLYKTMPAGAEKKIVQQKWESLGRMRAEFVSTRVTGGLRKSPVVVKLHGDSGVGKSSVADLVMATANKAMNVPSTSEYIVTLNDKEKYMSTYRSYVTGIKIDDYGNSKAEFWETAPSDWIIKICNNIREAAVMADLANKGKITIEPRTLTITTNVKNLHAGKTSNNPMSILRRCHIHATVKIRPEFKTDNMLDTAKVIDAFGDLDTIRDIWLIDVEKPVGDGPGKQEFGNWQMLYADMSIFEFLDYVADVAKKHDAQQTTIVDSFKEPSNLVTVCSMCNHLEQTCTCDFEPHFGERIATTLAAKLSSSSLEIRKMKLQAETRIEDFSVKALLAGFEYFHDSPYALWTSYIPESLMDNDYVKAGILYAGSDWIGQEVKMYVRNFAVFTLLLTYMTYCLNVRFALFIFTICVTYFAICYSGLVEAKKRAYLEEIHKRRGVLPELFKSVRDKHVNYACGFFASLAVIYGVVKVVKALRTTLSVQGSLAPKSIQEIQQRDTEENVWKKETKTTSDNTKWLTSSDAASKRIYKSAGQIVIGNQFSGAFAVTTNVIAIPFHFLPTETSVAQLSLGTRIMKFVLNPDSCVRVGESDLALVYVANTGPLRNTVEFFPQTHHRTPTQATVYGLDSKGDKFSSTILWNFVSGVSNGRYVFNGAYYDLTGMQSFAGMCMSPIVAKTTKIAIVGFHIGGVTGTSKGCGVAVLQDELTFAIKQLAAKSKTFVLGPQASELQDVVAGKNIVVSEGVRNSCPTNYLDSDAAVEVYGSVVRGKQYDSNVVPTVISNIVEEVTGVPNQWGPPKFTQPIVREDGSVNQQRWKPWWASLSTCSKPSIGFDPVTVEQAMDDYLVELKETFDSQKALWKEQMRPLDNVEIVSGIDGLKFVDSMNASTSMGYPIGGPKSNWLVDLPVTDKNACPRTFKPEVWQMVDELMEKADNNEFLNSIFNASLKDEPTKLSKDKVRVFQAAPIALQIVIRKYYLPIARFLSVNPLVAECAVGINSHGVEWDELSNYMARFGDDRIIAGDYAKYDLRMPEQLTLTAFAVMLEIAEWSGNYSNDDLRVMKVIAHDVCSPLVAYNGTLLRFMGTNPSGQNMTVYLNSIVNSLLHRLAFFDCYDKVELATIGNDLELGRPATFRDLVALSTYGDDAKGSVREGYDKFNHISMAQFLARNDIVFTMPDKESLPVAFMNRFEADFLKRKDLFNPDLGVFVGALDENSIFKSLHAVLKSKVETGETVAASNIDGALREWFFHGRSVYERRREQMAKIAAKADLAVPGLLVSYEERVQMFKEKNEYQPQSGVLETDYTPSVEEELEEVIADLSKLMGPSPLEDENGYTPASDKQVRKFVPIDLEYRVRMVLGKPSLQNHAIGSFGEFDLVYESLDTILTIECKQVRNHPEALLDKAKAQAVKYAHVMKLLKPGSTVYGMIYTEYGFSIVTVLGEPRIPPRFEKLLKSTGHIDW